MLTIGLGRGSSLSYNGDTLTLAAAAFSPRGQISAERSLLTDLILAPITAKITPGAVISGNTVYSFCDQVRINGRGSTGDGGRGLTYTWGIEFASGVDSAAVSASDNSGLTALQSKLSALHYKRNQIRFLASELASNLEYKVTLKVFLLCFSFVVISHQTLYKSITTGKSILIEGGLNKVGTIIKLCLKELLFHDKNDPRLGLNL